MCQRTHVGGNQFQFQPRSTYAHFSNDSSSYRPHHRIGFIPQIGRQDDQITFEPMHGDFGVSGLRRTERGSFETMIRDPQTKQEWQEAVDMAHALLSLDACRQYGLVTGGPKINLERCEELLRRAREYGYFPREEAIADVVRAINLDVERRRKRATKRQAKTL